MRSNPQGVKVPGPGLQREVLAGVVLATSQSWSEYLYALRTYQSKLQQDETFYNLHAALRSKDKAEAKKAEEAITKFIGSIQTKANTAKMGVRTCPPCLLRRDQPLTRPKRASTKVEFSSSIISLFGGNFTF